MVSCALRFSKVLIASFTLAVVTSPASAQIMIDPIGAYQPGYIASVHSSIEASIRAENPKLGSVSEDEEDAGSAIPISFRYTASKARTRANLAQFVAKTRVVDPGDAAKLEALFASTDVIGVVDGEMRMIGLRADDVADAYALWWAVAWYAVQGRESETDQVMLAAVRAQAARAFEGTGKFDGASDAVKQEMAESLMVQAAMADAANDLMRGDPEQRKALSAAVNKGARGMGLDLTSMTLTRDGFQPRPRG